MVITKTWGEYGDASELLRVEDKQNAQRCGLSSKSTNWASWQTNLTWTPTAFEDKEINVHQGAHARKEYYDRVEKLKII